MITNPKHSRYMGKKYYTYEGKKKSLGGLSKMFNDLVLVEDEWVEAVRSNFRLKGYQQFLAFVKAVVRNELSIDLTDAQAWLVIHDITNDGVPMALRDTTNDEDANAATILKSAVGAVANTMMAPLEATAQAVQKPFKKSTRDDVAEDLPTEETLDD